MNVLRSVAAPAIAILRRQPLLKRLLARVRRARYERSASRFERQGTGVADRMPVGVVYEATMRCNLHCEFCYVGDLLNIEGQWREELTLEMLDRAFPRHDGLQVSLTGGEVFMRKDILEVLDLFARKKYVCGYLTTNGTIIDENRAEALAHLAERGFLKHISISIDGPGQLHDRARGVAGTFERTSAGLRRLQDAARRRGVPLKVSINTTVTAESLTELDAMADVAAELGVTAIGLNHLMFATPEEARQTAGIIGEPDTASIATFITPDPGVAAAAVRTQVDRLREKCRQAGILFDVRPKVWPAVLENYYSPGAPLLGRCLYPFLHARVGFSGKVYFCPFIRVEVGDLAISSLEDIWNGPRYVALRKRLLERRLFPVCRRCCKVELSPDPVPSPEPVGRRTRVIPLTPISAPGPRPDAARG